MILVDLGNLSFVTKSGSAKMAQDAQKNENMDVDVDGDGEWSVVTLFTLDSYCVSVFYK